MSYAFQALAPEYSALLSHMVIDGNRLHEFESTAARILAKAEAHAAEWDAVHKATAVPPLWGIASFERESGSNYMCSPAQGDRWDRVSRNVPSGRGPFRNWGESCIDAYHIDHLEKVGDGGWTWIRATYEGEIFNGMGYRKHGRHSAYLYAGTNIYNPVSKFTSDGHFVDGARDQQLGMVPLMFTMVRLKPALALDDAFPGPVSPPVVVPPSPAPVPAGHDGGEHGVEWLQTMLCKWGDMPIAMDGNFGRATRRAVYSFQRKYFLHGVDGLAGPETLAKINALENSTGR